MNKIDIIIERLNNRNMQLMNSSYSIGLAQGRIGICIYYYYLYKFSNDEKYRVIADGLLDNIINEISLDLPITVESGLAGVALGIIHLLKEGFVEGDVNELLENIDNVIFKNVIFLSSSMSYKKNELLYLLYFLSIRLDAQCDDGERYIYQELIIKVIDLFCRDLKKDFFNEYYSFSVYDYHLPVFAYVFGRLLKQNFYNGKILKIINEYESFILSIMPILHSNRLYLLCGIIRLLPFVNNVRWIEYANQLKKGINMSYILKSEMKNKHIFISNGLSMIYMLLYYLDKNYPDYRIAYDSFIITDMIHESEAWDSLIKNEYFFNIHNGLLNGFPGVHLLLLNMKNNRL